MASDGYAMHFDMAYVNSKLLLSTTALLHHFTLGGTLLADFFWISDQRAIDFDAVTLAQDAVEFAELAENAELVSGEVDLRVFFEQSGALHGLLQRAVGGKLQAHDILPLRQRVNHLDIDGGGIFSWVSHGGVAPV